jgi:FdhD protein
VIVSRDVWKLGDAAGAASVSDALVVEEPLEIQLDCNPLLVTMRTPGDDRNLALGLLYAEGIISSMSDVLNVVQTDAEAGDKGGNLVNVLPTPDASAAMVAALTTSRGLLTTSACGVCGRDTIDDLLARCRPLEDGPVVGSGLLLDCVRDLRSHQPTFHRTGGLHAAAVYTQQGKYLVSFEDIGRHNAVDKAIGALLARGLVPFGLDAPDAPAILIVSGRAGFEIVQKAAVARIPIIASVSAASSLAVDLAESCRMTLVGFARGASGTVYTDIGRIDDPPHL